MSSVFFIALRRLRLPLILMIVIFAVATIGLTLIPGVDAEGRPWRFSIFQALYFVAYTATTIGFGEVPHPFTDTQRLWVTCIIFLSVVGWAFLVSALLALGQDAGFRHAIVAARFRRGVRALRQPFYLVCGLGETGLMVISALDRMDFQFVAIDKDPSRLYELDLLEHSSDTLSLAGDARLPETLITAGILKPECKGVLALSSDDEVNLAVALAAQLLHPGLPTICRSLTPAVSTTMREIGHCQVVDPFEEFGRRLLLAIEAPDSHRLLSWLTEPGVAYLRPRVPAPPGAWIVCGYGRFGAKLVAAIERGGFEAVVIDPAGGERHGGKLVKGLGTDRRTLVEAGLENAAGIVAGTDDDIANLAIAITARQLRPDVFVIARQNLVANRPLFEALGASMTMVSSEIIANECVATLRTPLLRELLEIVRAREDAWAGEVVARLGTIGVETRPELWSCTVSKEETPGLLDVLGRRGAAVALSDLMRRPGDRAAAGSLVALLLVRGGKAEPLPSDDIAIEPGDRLLFAGTLEAELEQRTMLRNANVASYVLMGDATLGGSVWRWAARRIEARQAGRPGEARR